MVLAGLLVTGADAHVLVLATTSCLAAIYTVGCAAGIRLLPRGSLGRGAALAATVMCAGLLLLAGPFLAWPLVLATGALTTRRVLGRRVPNAPYGTARLGVGAGAACRRG
jgi:amino acid efflux transporter